jgi:ribonucleotide monophosphatase NagD (HAD superfamily)
MQDNLYNLAFGDWNEEEQRLDDLINSNNQDTDKIFATIAAAIMDFNKHYPGATIYVIGSTPARTRLYQMQINKYLDEIAIDFEVFGVIEHEQLVPFGPGIKYLSFIARRKSL